MATARGVSPGFVPKPDKPKRRNRQAEEQKIQREVNKWWLNSCASYGLDPCLYYSVPNGFIGQGKEEWQKKGALIKAWMLKLAGVKSGIPDDVLAVMRKGFGALYIEYKTPDGVVDDEQIRVQAKLSEQGYSVHVCRSAESGIETIKQYLK
jgi:hypothetical protein